MAIAIIGTSGPALAFIQDKTPSGDPIRWNLAAVQPNISGGRVEYVINRRGSDDVAFSAVVAEVEAAFVQWRFIGRIL